MTFVLFGLLFLVVITGYIVIIQLADHLVHVVAVVLLVVLSIIFGSLLTTHRANPSEHIVESK